MASKKKGKAATGRAAQKNPSKKSGGKSSVAAASGATASGASASTGRASKRPAAAASGKKTGGAKSSSSESRRVDLQDLRTIEHLMKLMGKTDVVELELQDGPDQRLRLSRRGSEIPMQIAAAAPMHMPAPAAPAAAGAGGAEEADDGKPAGNEFLSPMVGTFYRAPSPEAAPYIVPGDRVNPDTVLCIIEAMKVLNEIRAETSGEVVDVLVENGEAVEYGQPLFLIRPSGS